MHLPPRRIHNPTPSVLPRRRDALGNPGVAWDLLDDLHRIPGVLGTAISTRTGRIVLVDVSAENEQPMIEMLARHFASRSRDVTNRLDLGPLRTQIIQGVKYTIASAPVGPGMLTTVAQSRVSVALLRIRLSAIQDELGRVELDSALTLGRNTIDSQPKQPTRTPVISEIIASTESAPDTSSLRNQSPSESTPSIATRNIAISDVDPPADIGLDEIQATEIVDEFGVVMCFIPGGTFLMGSEDSDDERPVHEVVVNPFLIDKYPVTNQEYAAFLAKRNEWAPQSNNMLLDDDYLSHWRNGRIPTSLAQHPVVWVSWWQALKGYCAWRGSRLPTEAEWEFTGRGNDGRIYPWGNVWRTHRCNHYKFGSQWTSSVGEFPAGRSPFGAMDLSGNVWEWCSDWYSTDYYATSERQNPVGPSYGRARAIRGGSRFNHAQYLKLTKRLYFPPHRSDLSIGFRCVKPWPPKFVT